MLWRLCIGVPADTSLVYLPQAWQTFHTANPSCFSSVQCDFNNLVQQLILLLNNSRLDCIEHGRYYQITRMTYGIKSGFWLWLIVWYWMADYWCTTRAISKRILRHKIVVINTCLLCCSWQYTNYLTLNLQVCWCCSSQLTLGYFVVRFSSWEKSAHPPPSLYVYSKRICSNKKALFLLYYWKYIVILTLGMFFNEAHIYLGEAEDISHTMSSASYKIAHMMQH